MLKAIFQLVRKLVKIAGEDGVNFVQSFSQQHEQSYKYKFANESSGSSGTDAAKRQSASDYFPNIHEGQGSQPVQKSPFINSQQLSPT